MSVSIHSLCVVLEANSVFFSMLFLLIYLEYCDIFVDVT